MRHILKMFKKKKNKMFNKLLCQEENQTQTKRLKNKPHLNQL